VKPIPFLLLLSCTAGIAYAQTLPAGFGWFAAVAGACWVSVSSLTVVPSTRSATSQFGKFLRGTASLSSRGNDDIRLQFEGDSIFAWDEAAKRIVYYIWGSDGSHSLMEAYFIGDELAFPVASRKEPSQIAYRSVWRRVTENTFEVWRERPGPNGWGTELTVVYHRSPLNLQGSGK
jgi:hypothetical protein